MKKYSLSNWKNVSDSFYLAMVIPVCVLISWTHLVVNFDKNFWFIHLYFVENLVLTYSQGFVRRGFLGTVGELLGGIQHNLPVLNCFAVFVFLGALFVWYKKVSSFRPLRRKPAIFLIAFSLSPLLAVFIETLGDPMQFVLLMSFAVIPFLYKKDSPFLGKWIVVFLVMTVAILIHEAALFLVGPAFLLILLDLRKSCSDRAYGKVGRFLPVAILSGWLVLLLFCIMKYGEINIREKGELLNTMYAVNPFLGTRYQVPEGSHMFLSFREIYELEGYHFSLFLTLKQCLKVPRVFAVPFLFAAMFFLICHGEKGTAGRRVWKSFLSDWMKMILGSLPLYVIAHDWGRFTAYVFCLALYLSIVKNSESLKRPWRDDESEEPVLNVPFCEIFRASGQGLIFSRKFVDRSLISLVFLMVVTYPVRYYYRVSGLSLSSFFIFLLVLPAAAIFAFDRFCFVRNPAEDRS